MDEDDFSQDFLPREYKGYYAHTNHLRPIVEEMIVEEPGPTEASPIERLLVAEKEASSDLRESITALLYSVAEVDVEALYTVELFSQLWKPGTYKDRKCRCSSRQSLFLVKSWPSFTAQEVLISTFLNRVAKIRDTNARDVIEKWAAINPVRESEVYQLIGDQTEASNAHSAAGDILVLEEDAVTTIGISQNDIVNLATSYDSRTLEKIGNLLRYSKVIGPTLLMAVSDDTR